MKAIKRWTKNLYWLFNHPPILIKSESSGVVCDYCGKNDYHIWNHAGVFCICSRCQKEAFDKILKGEMGNDYKEAV